MNGVPLGAAISIVLLIRQAVQPRVTELRAPARRRSRIGTPPENEPTTGVAVIRCESALLYFNVDTSAADARARERQTDSIRSLFFLGSVPKVDLAGAELLADLERTFRGRGIAFRLAEAHGEVRDALRRIGFDREHGPLHSGQTVDLIVSQWLVESANPRPERR